ncbi:cytochrome P450 [Micromonospora sonneratiae]|uniref:Cytochrome P450 n=1 Tax=Micromonospora sonneratiae TaxID=1184706 RepID=A0ABW3YDR9_9ACTN
MPGPRGLPYVGSALDYEDDPLGWMIGTRAEYGDVVRLDPESIVVHDPRLVHHVLVETNADFILDNSFVGGRRGRQELLAGLPEWMSVRRYLNRGVVRPVLLAHVGRIEQRMSRTVSLLAGREVDLFFEAQRLLGTATADYCIGGGDDDVDEVASAVEEVFWASLEVTDSNESRLPIGRRPVARRARALNTGLVELLTDLVRRRRAAPRPDTPRDVLDRLLDHPLNLPDREIVGVVRLLIVTSHGPAGAALAWCLLSLAEQPNLLRAVREEIATTPVRPDRLPGEDWPLTSAVLKETLRMHPPNWMMGRTAVVPTPFGPHRLRAGERVLFSPYLIHRDPRHWTDPEVFHPERWLTGARPHTEHAYLPFGAGTRICPGARLGPVQLAIAVATIVRDYTLTLPPLATVRPATSTLLVPVKAIGHWTPLAAAVPPAGS